MQRTSQQIARRTLALGGTVLAATLALLLALPSTAQACGGFFCNSGSPIRQQGEQIVFTVGGGTVNATIQINYAGEASDFAWVVPVASVPIIDVGPQQLFNDLRWRTDPYYSLIYDWEADGDCGYNEPYLSTGGQEADLATGIRDDDGVEVLESGEVGPYMTVVLDADNANALYEWLNDNGFDQPEDSIPLIEHYLENDMFFLALKLKQDAGVGEIQPLVLTMEEDEPCVPLILTRIAASPDMPIRIYVLGEHRAAPSNWMHVEVNEKKINWIQGGFNYASLLNLAIDEAAGHGFTTEYAGPSDIMASTLWWEGRFDLEGLLSVGNATDFLQQLLWQGFPRDSQLQGLIKKHIPKPPLSELPGDCQTDQEFYTWNLTYCLEFMPSDWFFNPVAFVEDLDESVVRPLREAQKNLDDNPYLTRLYSTVSPDEMTRDPLFIFNADLPEVPRERRAQAIRKWDDECTLEGVNITLSNGESFTVTENLGGYYWWDEVPEDTDAFPNEPAAGSITLIGSSGDPVEIPRHLIGEVDARLDTENPSIIIADLQAGVDFPATSNPKAGSNSGTSVSNGSGNSGCTGGPVDPSTLGSLLALLGLALLRRRA